jgi:predicted 2-oxoglutarate/Fe(II)-dependent dioxygenase YbiX
MNDALPDRLSPVHFAEIENGDAVNARLIAAYQRERDGEQVRRSHSFGGRFENTYIDAARLPELEPVRRFALACARAILGRQALRSGFWFNEMHTGHETSLHTHEENDELLSAVYYVSAPPDSGRLVLHDEEAQILVTPRAGLLVLFPPDLPHAVERNASDRTRLSVAFNFGPPQAQT